LIDVGFTSLYNKSINRIGWEEIHFPNYEERKINLAFKGLLDSLALGDGNERLWASRFEDALSFVSLSNLDIVANANTFHLLFKTPYRGGENCTLGNLKQEIAPLLETYKERQLTK
jgi:hypothetical protein